MKVLVTGSEGFLGRNLCAALRRRPDVEILPFDLPMTREELDPLLEEAALVFHLAGSNRPQRPEEFTEVNRDLTAHICHVLAQRVDAVPVVFCSSSQAALDNPYGQSKRQAEEVLETHAGKGFPVHVFRLLNLFGKWGRPNYNSVVTTFCHNSHRDLPMRVDNPQSLVRLNYVDDVVAAFLKVLDGAPAPAPGALLELDEVHEITVGELRDRVLAYTTMRKAGMVPDMANALDAVLYPTWLSYLPEDDFATTPELKTDPRGWLFEWIKSPGLGQVFVSTTKPGITRGNHFHDTKVESFCVVRGQAVIRFRQVDGKEVLEYAVDGDAPQVVSIPPGYTHSIENTGTEEMLCLFWSNQIFDPAAPDTHFIKVMDDK
jgi:UDP-2-acetamido-2,6-beta-L-arabino-hexul-4-ose reductase